jgi:hypothetical protein
MVDYKDLVNFRFSGTTSDKTDRWDPETGISICVLGKGIDRQILHVTNILGWMSPLLSNVVHLTINSLLLVFESKRVTLR